MKERKENFSFRILRKDFKKILKDRIGHENRKVDIFATNRNKWIDSKVLKLKNPVICTDFFNFYPNKKASKDELKKDVEQYVPTLREKFQDTQLLFETTIVLDIFVSFH